MDAFTLFAGLRDLHVKNGDEKEWGRVYSSLFEIPNAPYTTFIKLKYFRECKDVIQRYQDIPAEYRIFQSPIKLFVSHKWESREHPDKSRRTLEQLLSLTQNCNDDAAVWLDYCSLPQRNSVNGKDDRSSELKNFFKYQLSLIPLVILDSQCMFLWASEGINSGWCCIELLIAQALLQHLNMMVYKRKDDFVTPPLFVTQIGNTTQVETDLIRYDHQIFQKMYCNKLVIDRHKELISWLNGQLNNGKPTPYTQVLKQVTPELISKMISTHNLAFTYASDFDVVSEMLFKIYSRLSLEPFNSFKWSGQIDFFSTWHYIKGCLGDCVVPTFAYWF